MSFKGTIDFKKEKVNLPSKFKKNSKFSGKFGGVQVDVDLSGFWKGLKVTDNRVKETAEAIGQLMVPYYRKLILRTPVWRGTARLNWYLEVDGKPNRSGQRFGGANKFIKDQHLERIANKFGKPDSADKIITQNPMNWGRPIPIYNSRGILKSIKEGVPSQTQYGVLTPSVERMVTSAEKNIKKHFKAVGGGPRSQQMTSIRIYNKLPYIQFLEGRGSSLGSIYMKGHKAWISKEGRPPFINKQNFSGNAKSDPDALGKYREGYISRTFGQMKSQFTKYLDKDVRRYYKSKRVRVGGSL